MTIPVNSGLTYFRVMTLCDGIVLASPECYEPNTIAALREWMAETSRPIRIVPMTPCGSLTDVVEKRQPDITADVEDSLTFTLDRRGERSPLYVRRGIVSSSLINISSSVRAQICFSTVHWSAEPEKFWSFLETVIELNIPFLSFPSYLVSHSLLILCGDNESRITQVGHTVANR